MQSILDGIPALFQPINIIDVLIIAFAIYKIMDLIHGQRAEQLAKGILILLAISVLANMLGLSTVSWVLTQIQRMLVIAIPIIFAPELRRLLERLGKGATFRDAFKRDKKIKKDITGERVDKIMSCLTKASSTKTGVLIAIKRKHSLLEYEVTGIPIHGILSSQLLNNIFIVNTPLHDGAVIVDGDEIVAASCYLPLSENRNISKSLGTRHRAAIGLSEETDAVVVTVSEETGSMSIALDGKLSYDLSRKEMVTMLMSLLSDETEQHRFQKGKRVSE